MAISFPSILKYALAMAALHTCPSLDMPLYDAERNHLWYLQNDQFVSWFESQTWQVEVKLGLFEDGQYFLHLHVLSGVALRLMDEAVWANTCCNNMPVHITLGWPLIKSENENEMALAKNEFERQLALTVKGENKLTVKTGCGIAAPTPTCLRDH